MKYLVLLVVVLFFAWRWRAARIAPVRDAKQARAPRGDPQATVACGHCGVHVPAVDAITGTQGNYCSAAHRQLQER